MVCIEIWSVLELEYSNYVVQSWISVQEYISTFLRSIRSIYSEICIIPITLSRNRVDVYILIVLETHNIYSARKPASNPINKINPSAYSCFFGFNSLFSRHPTSSHLTTPRPLPRTEKQKAPMKIHYHTRLSPHLDINSSQPCTEYIYRTPYTPALSRSRRNKRTP